MQSLRRCRMTSFCSIPGSIRCALPSWSPGSRIRSASIRSPRPTTSLSRSRSAISCRPTKMPPAEARWLRDWLDDNSDDGGRTLSGPTAQVALAALARSSSLCVDPVTLQGRCVLIAARDQLTAALAAIELDGVARRIVLLPPDVPREHLEPVMADAAVDVVVGDDAQDGAALGSASRVTCAAQLRPITRTSYDPRQTEWVLFTSGTTGRPKMVIHSLAGLAGAIVRGGARDGRPVWGTFYDIRR